jgi:hypothetical protein
METTDPRGVLFRPTEDSWTKQSRFGSTEKNCAEGIQRAGLRPAWLYQNTFASLERKSRLWSIAQTK